MIRDTVLTALDLQDKSFTLTLFAHTETFDSLDAQLKENNPAKLNPVVELFRTEFADAYELMGKDGLMKSWTENPKDGLITVEVSRRFPYAVGLSTDDIPPVVLSVSLRGQGAPHW